MTKPRPTVSPSVPDKPGYAALLADALAVICGAVPPPDLVSKWIDGDESHADGDLSPENDTLQDWAAQNSPREWMMGITIIDAAEALAGEPRPYSEWYREGGGVAR